MGTLTVYDVDARRIAASPGRRAVLICAIAILFFQTATAQSLSLRQAWERAEQANPTLRQARASLRATQGALEETQALLWNNPEIFVELRHRDASELGRSESNFEETIGLSQTFELAGQQAARRDIAELDLAAIRHQILELRRQVRLEVEQRFVHVLTLQERIEAELATLRVIEEAAQAVALRVSAGEDSLLEGNLAEVDAGRARNEVALLRERLTQARFALAVILQLRVGRLPKARGSLQPMPIDYTLQTLLDSAGERPGLRALRYRVEAATSRLGLERARVYPDITVSLSRAREVGIGGDDEIIGLGVSVPIPLFRHNDADIGRAATQLMDAHIERQRATRNVRARVTTLWSQLHSLSARVARLRQAVLPPLRENLRLSTRSYQAGEIGLTQLLLVNRQALEARRDLIGAVKALRLTRSALEAAAGWTLGRNLQ